jgi:hypothetical protein
VAVAISLLVEPTEPDVALSSSGELTPTTLFTKDLSARG